MVIIIAIQWQYNDTKAIFYCGNNFALKHFGTKTISSFICVPNKNSNTDQSGKIADSQKFLSDQRPIYIRVKYPNLKTGSKWPKKQTWGCCDTVDKTILK